MPKQEPQKNEVVRVSDHARDEFVSSPNVSALLGFSDNWLRMSRMAVPVWDGPPYHKIGGSVRYRWGEVLDWLDARRIDPARRVAS